MDPDNNDIEGDDNEYSTECIYDDICTNNIL